MKSCVQTRSWTSICITIAIMFSGVPHSQAGIQFTNTDWDTGLWNGLRFIGPGSSPSDPAYVGYGYTDAWSLNIVSEWDRATALEELSGEWAAAIYYDGIATGTCDPNAAGPNNAVWFTPRFIFPDWRTNSSFFPIICDPNFVCDPNTVSYCNLDANLQPTNHFQANPNDPNAYEEFTNGQVDVRIDYHVADLGGHYRLNNPTSPMNLGNGAVAYSGRYVLYQTYTITNKTANTLTNLEFYQMLHAHPNDNRANVTMVFSDNPGGVADALTTYTPPTVHSTGNFKYDITQWDDSLTWESTYIGFGSLTRPSEVEASVFSGFSSGKPVTGTHINIEKRALNGARYHIGGESAGVMKWSVGNLAASASWKITLVLMAGHTNYDAIDNPDPMDPNNLSDGWLRPDVPNRNAEDCNGNWVYDPAEGLTDCDVDGDGTPDKCELNFCLGDSNCDGIFDGFDISHFADAITLGQTAWENRFLPGTPSCPFGVNDINGDCVVDGLDESAFVMRLISDASGPCDWYGLGQ